MTSKRECWRPFCSDEGVFLVEDIGGWLCVDHYRRVADLLTPRAHLFVQDYYTATARDRRAKRKEASHAD